jgi:hypothetical protein
MVVTGLALIAIGVLVGLVFPVMFVAAVAGLVVLVIGLMAGGRRAQGAASGTEHRPE